MAAVSEESRPLIDSEDGTEAAAEAAASEDILVEETDDLGVRCGQKQQEPDSSSGDPNVSSSNNDEEDSEAASRAFECNICLDVASDAVISMCGHLFCWPCLHQWLETRPHRQICPVCKAGIGRDKVVPLYGRGDTEQKDPREKPIPPRPRGQRPEPETSRPAGSDATGLFNAGGFQMSFGIGAFPFGFFATNFNLNDGLAGGGHHHHQHHHPAQGSAQYEEEQFLHKVFLWVAFAFIFWLLIA